MMCDGEGSEWHRHWAALPGGHRNTRGRFKEGSDWLSWSIDSWRRWISGKVSTLIDSLFCPHSNGFVEGFFPWRFPMTACDVSTHTHTHYLPISFLSVCSRVYSPIRIFFLQRSGPFNFTTRIYCPDSLNESIPDWNGFFMATVSHSTWLFTPHFSSIPASMLSLFDCLLLLFPLLLPWARSIRCAADRFSIQSGQV